jgi:hypothetical protein
MLSVIYAKCQLCRIQAHFAKCHNGQCRYAECRYDKCRGASEMAYAVAYSGPSVSYDSKILITLVLAHSRLSMQGPV